MISSKELESIAGNTMVGQDGHKIGKIVDVYESTDGESGTFATVTTGLFGGGSSLFPLAAAEMRGDDVVVPYSKAFIKDAPRVENDEELTAPEEQRLFEYYAQAGGMGDATTTGTTTGTSRSATETAVPRGTARDDVDGGGQLGDRVAVRVGGEGPVGFEADAAAAQDGPGFSDECRGTSRKSANPLKAIRCFMSA